jgi:hypothetical protein
VATKRISTKLLGDAGKLDGYEQFFQILSKEEFITFGLENVISADPDKAAASWAKLVQKVKKKERDLHVRDFGRAGVLNHHLSALYSEIFHITIEYDKSNNSQPTRVIQELTGHRKNKSIVNYQVSHVFGRTKNVFCFTAPWNIVFLPKIVDPLSGHEAKGDPASEFKSRFQKLIFQRFETEIREFNAIMNRFQPEIEGWLMRPRPEISEKIRNDLRKEFAEIHKPA